MVFYGKCGTVYFTDGHSEEITRYDDTRPYDIETKSGRYFGEPWYKYDPTVFLGNMSECSPLFKVEIDRIEVADWVAKSSRNYMRRDLT